MMSESINIPVEILAETQGALDAALTLANREQHDRDSAAAAFTLILRVRAKLTECLSQNSVQQASNRASIDPKLKRKALSAIALLHEVANGLD
jgi:hypothetical protein